MVKRSFIIGDEWLYFKIYCGYKTADNILIKAIHPLIRKLISEGLIDNWFFIRYNDPDYHLRIRVHLCDKDSLGNIMAAFHSFIKGYFDESLVWKIQIDTYEREIERYGEKTIDKVEHIFRFDSELVLAFINKLPNNLEGENFRWLFCIKSIDNLLDNFGLLTQQKLDLLFSLKDNFGKEFGINSPLKRQLDDKYRKVKLKIEHVLSKSSSSEELKFINEVLKIREVGILKIIESMVSSQKNENNPLESMLPSLIHMQCNRIFKSKHRLTEMVIYDFAYRYYKSLLAKEKALLVKESNSVWI